MRDAWSDDPDRTTRREAYAAQVPDHVVGARVALDRLTQLATELGYDPMRVVSIECKAESVTVVEASTVGTRLLYTTHRHDVMREVTKGFNT